MKLFISSFTIDEPRLNTLEKSKSYSRETIYSPNGILLFRQRKWRKQNITKEHYYELTHQNVYILVEDNEYNYDEVYTHIPYEHIVVMEQFDLYRIDYNLSLVKHSYLNQTAFYFETSQSKIDSVLLDTLLAFLSIK
jgi:hypothetical protein